MINPGFTFLSRTPEYKTQHLYIVISIINTKALFVNVTTKKVSSDVCCVLNVGDHNFITRESVINYGDAKTAEIKNLEQAIKKHYMKSNEPVTDSLLSRIIKGAKNSNAFPQGFLKYLPQP